jgi:hypothetical protein
MPVPRTWAPAPLAATQLNLFAGQLYLASYAEYVRLCGFLGVSHRANTGDAPFPVDGFVAAAQSRTSLCQPGPHGRTRVPQNPQVALTQLALLGQPSWRLPLRRKVLRGR